MHLFNTVVETYIYIYIYTYTSARSVPLKYAKLQKQIEKKVYIYKFTTGPDGNFWIEKACKPRENGRPDDDVLCRALIVDTLSFIQCPYIIISLFTFPFTVGRIIYVTNTVCIEHCWSLEAV